MEITAEAESSLEVASTVDRTRASSEQSDQTRDSVSSGKSQPQNKQELLLKILKKRAAKAKVAINRADREQAIPLSWAQQRLWFLSQLEPDASRAYHVPAIFRLKGELDTGALTGALATLVSRHEILRTNFHINEKGEPYQAIQHQSGFHVESYVLPESFGSSSEAGGYDRLLQTIVSAPFDLAVDSLIHAALIKLDEDDHTLVLVLHHIVTDGWSMGVLTKELSTLYGAYRRGEANPFSELAIQYADYSIWQRNWLKGEVLNRESAFWRERLQGVPLLELPADRPRPPVQSYRGARSPLVIDAEMVQSLRALGREHGCTMFMTLLAVFKGLLHRYTQQNDLCVGTPVANRLQSDVEPLIGFFVNTLALRTEIDGSKSIAELLKSIREVTLSAYEHQMMPFERIVEVVQPERSQAYSPLFQVMLVLQNAQGEALDLAGLRVEYEHAEWLTSKLDLTLDLQEMLDGTLEGGLEYSTDLFDESTIVRFKQHFFELAKSVVASPERALCELEFLTEKEKHQLLVEWNDTTAPYPNELCIHELFEAQVEKTPDAVAVIFENQQLSYCELNAKANQLAHYLIERGVKPDTLVGICVERSIEMVVGILAILKAAGAYVPLDPDYPQARLAYMLEDADLEIVLTQTHLQEKTNIIAGRAVHLNHPDVIEALNAYPTEDIPAAELGLISSNLAYVIYTSGSTGKPKGVMIEHSGAVNLYLWYSKQVLPDNCCRTLLISSLSFDLTQKNIFANLCSGQTLVLPSVSYFDPSYLAGCIADCSIHLINCAPSAFYALAESAVNAQLGSLKRIVLGGEAVDSAALHRFLEQYPNCTIINSYGPTECTDVSSYQTFDELDHGQVKVPIGRGIPNTLHHILDSTGYVCPMGIPGELHIGGVGLARGYLNRPDLTAEKFIRNPFSSDPTDRLYKTGDLCRYLSDGNIEYIGRIDHQVKVRGFRIELGEIEKALAGHESIRDVVVLAKDNEAGDKHLVAYLVCEAEPAVSELREYLSRSLPDYMVPSAYVTVPELPLTPNGKIDKKALAALDVAQLDTGAAYMAPRNEVERQLVAIWSRVLNRPMDAVSVYDNFFDLGGHSLLATQIAAQIRNRLHCDVSVRLLFEAPTIASLAQWLGGLADTPVLPRIELLAERERLPASFAQERLWFLDQLDSGKDTYHVPSLFRLKGSLDSEALDKALATLVERHESLRTNLRADEKGQPYQYICSRGLCGLEQHVLPEGQSPQEQEAAYQLLIAESISKPFDLANDSLMRVVLIKRHAQEHTLVLVLHHIITDGWSMGILAQEFSSLYQAYRKGLGNPLTPLPIQYADYAVWQRNWLQGDRVEVHAAYWRSQLQSVPLLELPTDRPRPPTQSYRGAWLPLEIKSELVVPLKGLGQKSGCTLFMTLLSVFKTLLHRYTQQSDLCVGTPIAGRLQSDVEPLIGIFVNTLALRTQLDAQRPFTELLQQVKETTLAAYEHQALPFEQVVEAVQPERSQAYSPLFQVMLVLQNTEDDVLDLSDLAVEREAIPWATSKFDLTLFFKELPDGRLVGALEYASDLFDESTAARLSTHFAELVKSIIASPERALCELEFLTEKEKHQLLVEWNDTTAPYPSELCIQELFEAQVEKTPDAVAVIFETQQLSYCELNAKANQLAHYLIERGVKPDTLVGICVERSIDMVVGILAILKAGGAYVPLDPDYPKARLAYMLEDADLKIVLTQTHLREKTRIEADRALYLDAPELIDALKGYCPENPHAAEQELSASNLAYVIYTSGSTGKPKGVMTEHRALVNRIQWMDGHYGCDSSDVILQKTPFSFDVSVWEFFWPLASSATIVLAKPEGHKDPAYLSELIRERQVTKLHFVPSMLDIMLSYGGLAECSSLKQVFCSGEVLLSKHVTRFYQQCTHTELHNLYGPTEAAIDVSYWNCASVPADRSCVSVPIGQPIHNITLHILNSNLQLNPIGVVGELHIGGAGLARGYLNRPDLTAEKFIRNPFSSDPTERLYKTGDLCRYLPNGNIEYIGRIDHQVKVRGFRIELGEIEKTLDEVEHVTASAAIAKTSTADAQIVAFIVCSKRQDEVAIRRVIEKSLPDYMMPSNIIVIDSLPLTTNGKVDRKALQKHELAASNASKHEEPRNNTEYAVRKAWSTVLGLAESSIGIYSDFFRLGGASLSVVVLQHELFKRLGIKVGLPQLFRSGRLNDQATLIESLSYRVKPKTNDYEEAGRDSNHRKLSREELIGIADSYRIGCASVSTYCIGEVQTFLLGKQDAVRGMDLTTESSFRIHCLCKVIISNLCLVLCDKGSIDLDAPLSEQFPSILRKSSKFASVTLRQILSHTTGIDDTALESINHNTVSFDEFLIALERQNIMFAPGQGFGYGISGTILMAKIIETVTEMSWRDAVDTFLFEPLGIKLLRESQAFKNEVVAYKSLGGVQSEEPVEIPQLRDYLEPAGSAKITLSSLDLLKLAVVPIRNGRSLEGKRILSRQLSREMLKPVTAVENHFALSEWALGWYGFGDSLFGFGTSAFNHATFVAMEYASRKAMVIQLNGQLNLGFIDALIERFMGRRVLKQDSMDKDAILTSAVGLYEAQGLRIEVYVDNGIHMISGALLMADGSWGGDVKGELIPFSYAGFVISNAVQPFEGVINFLDFDSNQTPRYLRTQHRICKRVS